MFHVSHQVKECLSWNDSVITFIDMNVCVLHLENNHFSLIILTLFFKFHTD